MKTSVCPRCLVQVDVSTSLGRDGGGEGRGGEGGDSPATRASEKYVRDYYVRLTAPLSVVAVPAVAAPRPPI